MALFNFNTRSCCQIGVVLWLLSTGSCEDYVLTCPNLVANGRTTVYGTVDITNFTTCLLGAVSTVIFRIKRADGSSDDICIVPYPACPTTLQTHGSQQCRCTERNGTRLMYEMDFYFDEKLYNGTNLGILSNCLPAIFPLTSKDCEDLHELAMERGGLLVCPNTWTQNEEVELTFYIDRSKYPSRCTGGYSTYPGFESSEDNTFYRANCSVTVDITQPTGCSTRLGMGKCGCTSKNDSYYEITYKLRADSDYNGWWRPDLSCNDPSIIQQLFYTTSDSCSNVTVVGSVILSSSPSTTNSVTPLSGEAKGAKISSGAMAGIAAGFASLVIFVVIGVYAAGSHFHSFHACPPRRRKRGQPATHTIGNAPGQVTGSEMSRLPTKPETPLSSVTTSSSQDSSTEDYSTED